MLHAFLTVSGEHRVRNLATLRNIYSVAIERPTRSKCVRNKVVMQLANMDQNLRIAHAAVYLHNIDRNDAKGKVKEQMREMCGY